MDLQSRDRMCQQTLRRNCLFVITKFYFLLHLGQKGPLNFEGLMLQHYKHPLTGRHTRTDNVKYIFTADNHRENGPSTTCVVLEVFMFIHRIEMYLI